MRIYLERASLTYSMTNSENIRTEPMEHYKRFDFNTFDSVITQVLKECEILEPGQVGAVLAEPTYSEPDFPEAA